MGLLLVFAAGYVMGSRAGGETLDEVIDAAKAIRESEEFHDLLKALRAHVATSLHGLANMLEKGRGPTDQPRPSSDLVERVRLIAGLR